MALFIHSRNLRNNCPYAPSLSSTNVVYVKTADEIYTMLYSIRFVSLLLYNNNCTLLVKYVRSTSYKFVTLKVLCTLYKLDVLNKYATQNKLNYVFINI